MCLYTGERGLLKYSLEVHINTAVWLFLLEFHNALHYKTGTDSQTENKLTVMAVGRRGWKRNWEFEICIY